MLSSFRPWLCLVFAMAAVLAFAGEAQADSAFCPQQGTGAGECDRPQGVAADLESQRLYVADTENSRVNVFTLDGSFLRAFGWGVETGASKLEVCTAQTGCRAGLAGYGEGQPRTPRTIAVDNDPGSPSRGSVYVSRSDGRILKFDGDGKHQLTFGTAGQGQCQFAWSPNEIAVGPGGVVYASDSVQVGPSESEGFKTKVLRFDAETGACLGETVLSANEKMRVGAIAVDQVGNIYVAHSASVPFLAKYNVAGTKLCSHPGAQRALAIAPDGSLVTAGQEKDADNWGSREVLNEYDTECNPQARFGYGRFESAFRRGVAVVPTSAGYVFATDEWGSNGVSYLPLPEPGPLVPGSSVEVSSITNTRALFEAEVNPEGDAATEFRFDYLTEEEFDQQGGFEGPATKSTPAQALEVPAGEEYQIQLATATVGCANPTKELIGEGKCLLPEAEYRFRVVATNADNPDGSGEARADGPAFTTLDPLEFEALFATDVGTDTATLSGTLNPLGIPTTGYFEYVSDAHYQASGFEHAVEVPAVVSGEAELDFGAAETATTRSVTLGPLPPGTTFHYRLKALDPLIDEPLATEPRSFTTFALAQGEACPGNSAFRVGLSAFLPDCRAYELVSPLDKANGDIKVLGETSTGLPAALQQASVTGEKLAYGTYRAFGDSAAGAFTAQYIAQRDAGGWQSHAISPPRTKLFLATLNTLDTEFKLFTPDLCEAWLRTFTDPPLATGAPAGYVNLYRRQDSSCGTGDFEALSPVQPPKQDGFNYGIELMGVSGDRDTAIFRANDAIAASATSKTNQLYVSRDGEVRLVCILPNGNGSGGPCTAGRTPTSSDGRSRRANVQNAISTDGERIFWSAGDDSAKIFLRSNPFGEGVKCSTDAAPCTVAVSAAAETTEGTSSARYLGAAADGSQAIFTTGGGLYRYLVETAETELIADGYVGMLGLSEDAQRLYLVSTQVLGETDGPIAGKPNLYFHDAGEGDGTFTYIGTLSSHDLDTDGRSPINPEPGFRVSRVTADGLHATFMSPAPLTGHDNVDVASGEPDAQVYLYDAAAKELRCVSCNPTGGRPRGVNLGGEERQYWAAARIPGWSNILHASRVLAPDGSRMYFESSDALVARDTNGRWDVYQWERTGTGSCRADRYSYSDSARGCVDLISTGQDLRDASFVEASPSGRDVFFNTLESLAGGDYGLLDIYDARVDGGLPPPAQPAPECEGEACQNPVAAPLPASPSSLNYEGPGDLKQAARKRCGKSRVLRRGRCVAKPSKSKKRKGRKGSSRKGGQGR